jgi:subtilisin family serine protease
MSETKRTARGATWGGRPGRSHRSEVGRRVVVAALAFGTVAPILCTSSSASAAIYDPILDGYSMKAMTENIGATAFWDQGVTGAGIDVAVIDTGVAPVEGLVTPGKIIDGPDLSLESQAPNLAHLDTNGHGTFIAGLDSTLKQPYSDASADEYRGVAPDARIVSLKVGTADGGVDVTQMIAAINWVVDHQHDNGMNIRVLNLSYGTNSTQQSLVDPLSFAAERAWRAGIVVVAAAGNTGFQPVHLGGRRLRHQGHVVGLGRHRRNLFGQRERWKRPQAGLRRRRLQAAGPASAELVHRRSPP